VKLQETLLRQVLRQRCATAQQTLEEAAKARIEILKQHGELVILARHKLLYIS
jgi:hypothetical protein